MKNFDINLYKGHWYEIYRDKDVWYELGDHCVTATWNCNKFGSKIKSPYNGFSYDCGVSNKRYISQEDRVNDTDNSLALLSSCKSSGICSLKTGPFPEGSYYIVDTDYNNYSIEYSCESYGFIHNQISWLHSRTPRLEQSYIDYAK